MKGIKRVNGSLGLFSLIATAVLVTAFSAFSGSLNSLAFFEKPAQVSSPVINDTPTATKSLEVHFLDVGQGDCTLLKIEDHAMLIDAGDYTKGTAIQLYLKKHGVTSLDYLILTHPDADHIGGAPVIISKYNIDQIFMSDYQKNTKTYHKLIDALDYRNDKWSTPAVGNTYALGSAQFTILAPCRSYDSSNNSSISLLVQNGENKFLFTGDAEAEAESDILAQNKYVSADVYHVGHHGSHDASSTAFLNAVSPTWAVISCGIDNAYGHPHAETLNNLRSMGVNVFRTDEQGVIVATSNGTEITWNCSPTESWKPGEGTMNNNSNKPSFQK